MYCLEVPAWRCSEDMKQECRVFACPNLSLMVSLLTSGHMTIFINFLSFVSVCVELDPAAGPDVEIG